MSSRSTELLQVNQVEDYLFCPRKLYLTDVVNANHPEPARVQRGHNAHEMREEWIDREGERSVTIRDKSLGVVGTIDGIIDRGDYTEVVEIKDTPREDYYENELIQGVIYALLVERNYTENPVRLVFRSRSRETEVELTARLREQAIEACERARVILEGTYVPEAVEEVKCLRCPLRNACK